MKCWACTAGVHNGHDVFGSCLVAILDPIGHLNYYSWCDCSGHAVPGNAWDSSKTPCRLCGLSLTTANGVSVRPEHCGTVPGAHAFEPVWLNAPQKVQAVAPAPSVQAVLAPIGKGLPKDSSWADLAFQKVLEPLGCTCAPRDLFIGGCRCEAGKQELKLERSKRIAIEQTRKHYV